MEKDLKGLDIASGCGARRQYWADRQEDVWVAYIDRKRGRCNDYS